MQQKLFEFLESIQMREQESPEKCYCVVRGLCWTVLGRVFHPNNGFFFLLEGCQLWLFSWSVWNHTGLNIGFISHLCLTSCFDVTHPAYVGCVLWQHGTILVNIVI